MCEIKQAWKVLEEAYGPNWHRIPCVEAQWTVEQWCAGHDAHYYARHEEEFFIVEATEEAEAKGCPMVVVEELS